MNFRSKAFPAVVCLAALGLLTTACGGSKSYKAGTPAATGQAPDCSVAPLDLVKKTLKRELTGPVTGRRAGGVTCTYLLAKSTGDDAPVQVQLNSNADTASLDILRNTLKETHNKVNTIKGYGDEAFASSVKGYATLNNFTVRKGKVSVVIYSVADYKEIRVLMKEILAKL